MLATHQTHNMTPVIYEENTSQSKLLMYKPMPVLEGRNITVRKINKPRTAFSAIGLVIPFQPSMWDEKSIHSVWNNGMDMVKTKLKARYSEECSNTILARLEILFPKLNFNTHRKSLAIILTPAEEKIFYLSFPVKPVAFLSKSVSLLDLAANMQQESHFYYLVLNEQSACLYDYNNKQLRKVYENNNEPCPINLFKSAANTIGLLNNKYEKPVFVTGRPNMVEGICNSTPYSKQFFSLLYYVSPFNSELIQSIIEEITSHWDYWKIKFVKTKILFAKESGTLISHFDAVLKALEKCADGLLLVDKRLKYLLQKSKLDIGTFQIADVFLQHLENFLARGNRIEITKSGLLKDMGGIVLLQHATSGNSVHNSYHRRTGTGGSVY